MRDKSSPLVLRSVRAVVDALGGTKKTAATLGVVQSTISNWLAFECIPPKRFLGIAAVLKPLGYEPSPTLFREYRSLIPLSKNREAAGA